MVADAEAADAFEVAMFAWAINVVRSSSPVLLEVVSLAEAEVLRESVGVGAAGVVAGGVAGACFTFEASTVAWTIIAARSELGARTGVFALLFAPVVGVPVVSGVFVVGAAEDFAASAAMLEMIVAVLVVGTAFARVAAAVAAAILGSGVAVVLGALLGGELGEFVPPPPCCCRMSSKLGCVSSSSVLPEFGVEEEEEEVDEDVGEDEVLAGGEGGVFLVEEKEEVVVGKGIMLAEEEDVVMSFGGDGSDVDGQCPG